MHILQDRRISNGQQVVVFWERVCRHYQENQLDGTGERLRRSLKTKWEVLKHDVAKLCAVYKNVLDCRELEMLLDDILQRALDLYKERHPKQQGFIFLHC